MVQRYSSEQWEQMLTEYRNSSMTVKEWCQSKGIKESTLFYWMRRLKLNGDKKDSNTRWASVSISTNASSQSCITLTYGGFKIDINSGFDKNTLTDLLAVVIGLC